MNELFNIQEGKLAFIMRANFTPIEGAYPELSFCIDKVKPDFTFDNEINATNAALELIKENCLEMSHESTITYSEDFYINKAKSHIARESRRGCGNVVHQNIVGYKGQNKIDGGIILVNHNNKWAVVEHEGWKNYYVVIKESKK